MSEPPSGLDEATAEAVGGELFSALDPMQLVGSMARTVRPAAVVKAAGNLLSKVPTVLRGEDRTFFPKRDSRFADATWLENGVYRRMAQAYLLWADEMMKLTDNPAVDWRTRERSRLLMGVLTSAAAPTNTLLGNPAALKLALQTGGQSLIDGMANFVADVAGNRGLPSQVDMSGFQVGRDIAATPGAVVMRTDMFELLQYAPTTETVQATPLLLLPPPVNKYYFWDLSPGRSMIEYAVGRGITVFTIVWRDPRPGDGSWGVDAYLRSALSAAAAVTSISESSDVHVFGDCSGGTVAALLLSNQAFLGENTFRTATLGVTVLDFGEPGGIGVTSSQQALRSITERAARAEIISADSIADTFVWMRPDDLVWRYLVNNWLMGQKPPAFDVLFWNNDGQGLPSRFASDLTRFSLENSLIRPGAATALDRPVDLSAVKADTYVIAGLTDHISPWRACYSAVQHLGGSNQFILTPTGHVQSIIYPPSNPKAAFYTGPPMPESNLDADTWLARATKNAGSWWPHWVDWLIERSDGVRPAPPAPGNSTFPPLGAAPGQYVLGE
jgi:polyhydroxyalkanoate synthase